LRVACPLRGVQDPQPELFPDVLAEKPSFLCFLFFVLHAD